MNEHSSRALFPVCFLIFCHQMCKIFSRKLISYFANSMLFVQNKSKRYFLEEGGQNLPYSCNISFLIDISEKR